MQIARSKNRSRRRSYHNLRPRESPARHLESQRHPTQVGCVLVDLSASDAGSSQLLKRLQEAGSLLSIVIISGLVDSALLDEDRQAVGTLLVKVLGEESTASVPLLIKPYEVSTLLQMVEDGIAGSVHRRAKRLRG